MDDDDQRVPVFFVSHARLARVNHAGPPQDRHRYVRRFFDDLTGNVNELIGTSPGQVAGFVDLAEEGSDLWSEQVLQVAGTCQVLVCLLSTDYLFRSEWCPREWDVFARRRVIRRKTGGLVSSTAVVPVLWAPFLPKVPKIVGAVHRFTPQGLPPGYIAAYEENGVLGLMQAQPDVYAAVVWRLAMHIQSLQYFYHVEPAVPAGLDGLRTTFAEEDG